MWIPNDISEIEDAVRSGRVEETESFDAKAELPATRRKNVTLAVDVAAMSTDGGALLYGIGEDDDEQPTILQPIDLTGAAERVSSIVSTSITEVPYAFTREYRCPDDASKGYLLVVVPQSSRAPHQVTVGGEYRFYGRNGKTNRILPEAEVARLYQRREQWEQDRDSLLREAVEQAPFPPDEDLIYLYGFTRPVAPDRSIWERAENAVGGRNQLQQAMSDAAARVAPKAQYSPDLRSGVRWSRRGADEWRMSTVDEASQIKPELARYILNVRANIDGRGHLFCGRAGDRMPSRVQDEPGRLIIFEQIVAGNLAGFFAAMGRLYELGGYHGHVDVGLAVTGLAGAYSGTTLDRQVGFYFDHMAYTAEVYPRHDRVSGAVLSDPRDLVRRLLRHLFEATTDRDEYDPFD